MDSVSYRARMEQRRETRFAAEVGAMLHWDGVSQPVMIRNISLYGALVTGLWLPDIGDRVTLIADGLEVWATVVWKRPDRCGLLLSHAIDPLAVIAEARTRSVEKLATWS
ncbi:PilZ domain-containing protein [Sphingobium sp. CR2-8]|uniref:PilZ domain-containing protein n=1 Tax=Sphingobium sp. CR2-8 TaxID=1306534 RepID=UPI002DB9E176|nr:PilZ domain-containing protein [Sphingobium sp. CR2-8]MEC3911271.1 PilZ domain-containing protein [Sphingobium sp. CR2-8]